MTSHWTTDIFSENLKTTDTRVTLKPRFVLLGPLKWKNQEYNSCIQYFGCEYFL